MVGWVGKIAIGTISLLAADYWLRSVALDSVQEQVREELRKSEGVIELFGNSEPISLFAPAQQLSGIMGSRQYAADKFSNVLELIDAPPREGTAIVAYGDVSSVNGGSMRKYYSYPVRTCGAQVCAFNPDEMQEVPEQYYNERAYWTKACVLKPKSWGILWRFKVSYCTRLNRLGELVSGKISVLSYPRNPFDVWYAQLGNGMPPYGRHHYVYEANFVLGLKRYLGSE